GPRFGTRGGRRPDDARRTPASDGAPAAPGRRRLPQRPPPTLYPQAPAALEVNGFSMQSSLSYLSRPDLNPISSCSSSQIRMREATERASMAWLGRPPIPAEAFLDFPPCAWMNCRWFSHVVGAAS